MGLPGKAPACGLDKRRRTNVFLFCWTAFRNRDLRQYSPADVKANRAERAAKSERPGQSGCRAHDSRVVRKGDCAERSFR